MKRRFEPVSTATIVRYGKRIIHFSDGQIVKEEKA